MSYDLTFAKPKRKIAQKQIAEYYRALACGEPVDAFEILPVDDIVNALCKAYEDFEPGVKFPIIEDGHGSAEVFQTASCFTFCFRGQTAEMQRGIIGIFRSFGCPVYDPQSSVLYPLDHPFGGLERADIKTAEPPLQTKAELEAKAAGLRAHLEELQRKKREENRGWYEPVERLAAQIARECAGGRWQRLGIDSETCAAVLHNMTLLEQNPAASPPHDILLCTANLNLIWLGFLGAIPSGHEFGDSEAQARSGVVKAIEHFYGRWRDQHREYSNSEPMNRRKHGPNSTGSSRIEKVS